MRKLLFLISLTGIFFSSCVHVNTDSGPIFESVQEEIVHRTGFVPNWNAKCGDAVVEELLQNDLTVENAVYIALQNNRELQATYDDLGIANAQWIQAGLLKNPIFSLAYRFSTQSIVSDLIDMSILQDFLEILLIPLKKQKAAAELEATKAMVAGQILHLIAQTKIEFYHLQALQQVWSLKDQVLLDTQLSYEVAERLFVAGNIKEIELVEKRLVYEQTKIDIVELEAAILRSRERLNVHMGLWGCQTRWNVTKCLHFPCSILDLDHIENIAIANSFDLKAARMNLYATAAKYGIDTTKIVFPKIEAGASAEREEGVWFVGPAINLGIPFFDLGHAKRAEARAVISKKWNEYWALAVQIRAAVRSLRVKFLNAGQQASYYQTVLVPLAEENTSQILLQHNAMQLGVFDLLFVKKCELEKKIQSILFLQNYWISLTEIDTLLMGYLMKNETNIFY